MGAFEFSFIVSLLTLHLGHLGPEKEPCPAVMAQIRRVERPAVVLDLRSEASAGAAYPAQGSIGQNVVSVQTRWGE